MAGHSIHWLFWKEEVGGTKSLEKEESLLYPSWNHKEACGLPSAGQRDR